MKYLVVQRKDTPFSQTKGRRQSLHIVSEATVISNKVYRSRQSVVILHHGSAKGEECGRLSVDGDWWDRWRIWLVGAPLWFQRSFTDGLVNAIPKSTRLYQTRLCCQSSITSTWIWTVSVDSSGVLYCCLLLCLTSDWLVSSSVFRHHSRKCRCKFLESCTRCSIALSNLIGSISVF